MKDKENRRTIRVVYCRNQKRRAAQTTALKWIQDLECTPYAVSLIRVENTLLGRDKSSKKITFSG